MSVAQVYPNGKLAVQDFNVAMVEGQVRPRNKRVSCPILTKH